jgi:hypothetical protein
MLSDVLHPRMLDLDFDQVLAVLHGWLGEPVRVGVSVTVQPLQVAHMDGPLAAGPELRVPLDDADWEFSVGTSGGFAIRRDYFAGANFFPDSGRLITLMVDDCEAADASPTIEVHVVGPAAGSPSQAAQ